MNRNDIYAVRYHLFKKKKTASAGNQKADESREMPHVRKKPLPFSKFNTLGGGWGGFLDVRLRLESVV